MKMRIFTNICLVVALVAIFILLSEASVFAGEGENLPWNKGLEDLTNSLSGKTALYISMIGIFFAGGMLIFGGDLGNFGKTIMMVVLVGCMMGGLSSVAATFIKTGALLL